MDKPAFKLSRAAMLELYAARRYLGFDVLKETGLRMPVEVYFKDPRVAEVYKNIGIDPDFTTLWEPGLRDGPTSARFAVVDYDSTTNTLTPPAVWDEKKHRYVAPDGRPLDRNAIDLPQFGQLSVWAHVQNTLNFFESGFALGRRISWAFEGNRLIVVPHAGFQNAYYDRRRQSRYRRAARRARAPVRRSGERGSGTIPAQRVEPAYHEGPCGHA